MRKAFVFLACHLLLACSSSVEAQQSQPDEVPAGNEKVKEIFRTFKGRGVMKDDSAPTPAEQMATRFSLREGVAVDLVASEPTISQPLFLSWDSRGRMWVVQYRQYQYPAGLKVVKFDQHLRAVFDKVPEPPPHGVPGADRITVYEDTDGDGNFDTAKDVITGLNIATSVQKGPHGIWVLNPPYLLRYPDSDHDDVPDGDPEVHLSGFGLQDTHSVANSLLWGPDGWLYAANGSTTGGTVSSAVTRGVRFEGQCVWRYHPETKVFEIYAEGGGNTFSLDIDSKGRVFSGTNGGNKRGYYYPQGSYADKNWGKHGPLTNPYAFGYFHGMKFEGDGRRFAQAFAVYEGGLFPKEYDGTIVAPNALHNLVWNSVRLEDGSNYRTKDVENLLDSDDRWFRPVYGGVGPDGAIYVADWYDTRLSHVSPIDDWHKESGRVYRLRPTGASPVYREGNLRTRPSTELIGLFEHPNKWVRQRAMLELGWRKDEQVLDRLVNKVDEEGSLESLWAVNLIGGLDSQRASRWLTHEDEHIRRWVVRLLGDRHEGHPGMIALAKTESNVQVRSQLASSAKRVDAATGLAITSQLLRRSEDLADPHLPLMNWWAVEGHCGDWESIVQFLSDRSLWETEMFRQVILGRLMQRYASSGRTEDLAYCDQLIQLAPDADCREILLGGLNQAFQGRSIPAMPTALEEAITAYQKSKGNNGVVLAVRRRQASSVDEAIRLMRSNATELAVRIELAKAFGEVDFAQAVDPLLRLATARETSEPALQRVAISSLANYDDDRIPAQLIGSLYSRISNEHGLRDNACRTLASRESWAKKLLIEVNEWRLKARDVPQDVVQRLRTFDNPDVESAVNEAFGEPVTFSSQEKVAQIEGLLQVINASPGDAEQGKRHFDKTCGTCHKLFGQGKTIGPPLDGYERGNLKFWLAAIVDPSMEIREGFQTYKALTADGRVITGMVAQSDGKTVTIRTAENQDVALTLDDLEEFSAVKTSLMPEQVLKELSEQDIRDLFAYLRLGAGR